MRCHALTTRQDLNFAPFAETEDGFMDVGVLPFSLGRLHLLWIFLMAETGNHIHRLGDDAGNGILMHKARRCTLQPMRCDGEPWEKHYLDVDGEFFRSDVIMTVESHGSVCCVMGRKEDCRNGLKTQA